jgi:uncharacterized protein YggE
MRTLVLMILLTGLIPGIAAADSDRTVSVDGYAEIAIPPDKATLRMGVESRADTVQAARDQVADTVARFLKLTRRLGISDERVATAAAIVRPDYDWNPQTRERRLLGYTVTRELVVDLTDLEQLGQLTESALELGVNQVNPPELDTSRRAELERDALAEAARDARDRARTLAEALDARLGDVRTLQAAASFRPPMPLARGMLAAESNSGAETYQAGQITVTASVTASFDLIIP